MAGPLTARDLWALPRVGTPVAAADGGVVVVDVTTHDDGEPMTRVHRVDGERPVALTSPDAPATAPAPSPDGSLLAFVREVDERPQVHLLRLSGGEGRSLTTLALGVLGGPVWADDTTLLVVAEVARDGGLDATAALVEARAERTTTGRVTERRLTRFWDRWLDDDTSQHLLRVDVTTGVATDLTPDLDLLVTLPTGAGVTESIAVRDGLVVLCAADRDDERHGIPRWELWAVPLDGSRPPALLTDPARPGGGCSRPRFLPDGRVLYGRQRDVDHYASPIDLRALTIASSRTAATDDVAVADALDHQPQGWVVTTDGRIVYAAEEGGRVGLFRRQVDGAPASAASTRVVAEDVAGSFGAPVLADGRLFTTHSSLTAAPQVVEVVDGMPVPRTDFGTALLADRDLATVHERTVAGADGDPVQVLVLTPPGWEADGSWPLVHLVHGGPHGVFGDGWFWRWCAQVFAAAGHVVAMVNFHGSTSFGHAFTGSILGDWMTAPVADVLAATDDLVAAEWVDASRMAIAGGSYGGYLVTQLATHTDRFRCVVAHAAVTDFAGMWASDVTQGLGRAQGAELYEDPGVAMAASPHLRYATYTTPTLVVHGELDLRVPVAQGLALYGVLRAKGVAARLLYYPDENHWVLQRDNSLQWYDEVLGWIDRHVAAASTGRRDPEDVPVVDGPAAIEGRREP